jgi:hypothetical protein
MLNKTTHGTNAFRGSAAKNLRPIGLLKPKSDLQVTVLFMEDINCMNAIHSADK